MSHRPVSLVTQQPTYGPHPVSQMRTELGWEGKVDEYFDVGAATKMSVASL
jgi:hypothetical protein